MSNDKETPRPASSIIPVRDAPEGGIEVLMTRRRENLLVLGGFFVFPGGTLDDGDLRDDIFPLCKGLNPENAVNILGGGLNPTQAMGHWVAALRELFEEAGILLAYSSNGDIIDFGNPGVRERLYSYRQRLQRGELSFSEMLKTEKLTLATDRLYYFKHLVTPPGPWRRFDARFFITDVPETQRPRWYKAEVSEGLWISPREALRKAKKGEWKMITPTLLVLTALEEHDSAEELAGSLEKNRTPV